jgi:hypothetical protein
MIERTEAMAKFCVTGDSSTNKTYRRTKDWNQRPSKEGQGVPRAELFGQLDSGQTHFSLHPLSFHVFVCKFWLLAMAVQLGSCKDPIL